jgi:hypothetical protein
MLYTINPTHQQHRLQVEDVVFSDDAEHTSEPFPCAEESDFPSTDSPA